LKEKETDSRGEEGKESDYLGRDSRTVLRAGGRGGERYRKLCAAGALVFTIERKGGG